MQEEEVTTEIIPLLASERASRSKQSMAQSPQKQATTQNLSWKVYRIAGDKTTEKTMVATHGGTRHPESESGLKMGG